jgi:hypothetical protein
MYGRRQHELQERRERSLGPVLEDAGGTRFDDGNGLDGRNAPIFGLFSARLGFAEGGG